MKSPEVHRRLRTRQEKTVSKYSAKHYLDLINKDRWYIIANRTKAVVYINGSDQKFHFVERISNIQGCLSETELDSDKPGRIFSSAANGCFHHSLDRRHHRHEHVAKKFAKEIATFLERAQRELRFGTLVLVAEPHFLGLLRSALPPAVQRVVEHEVGHQYEGSDDKIRHQIFESIESK